MAGGDDVLDRAVRKKDSEFHFVSRLFTDCSFDRSLPLASILRMSAPQPFFPSRHALIWIEAIYPIPLLGEMQGGSTRHAPDPTPRMREPLRLRQITLAPLQLFFRPLALTTLCFQRLVDSLKLLNCSNQVIARAPERFCGPSLRGA